MKKILCQIHKNPMLYVFMIIILFFMPIAIFSPGESRNRGVVTALGIDKIKNEYEVSLLAFIPTANQSFDEEKSVISGKGETIADALYQAQIAMGRKIGLFHAKLTVVNEDLLNEDVTAVFDYLSRVSSLPENTVFISTNKTAKELLQASQTLKTNVGLKLEQVVGFNSEYLYVSDTSLEAFYKGYYSPEKSSIIGYLCLDDTSKPENDQKSSVKKAELAGEIEIDSKEEGSLKNGSSENDTNSTSSDSQSSGDGDTKEGGSQSGEENPKEKVNIVNCGHSLILKNGKKVEKISVDTLNYINLLNPRSKSQIIKIKDFDYGSGKADVGFKVKSKRVLTSTKFENNVPVYQAQLILGVELVEINGNHENLKIKTEFSDINKDVSKEIDKEIKSGFSKAINLLKKNNTDVIGVNQTFMAGNRKEYKKFISQNGGAENFIENVVFKLAIVVQPD